MKYLSRGEKEATLEEMVKGRTYLFEQLKQWGWFSR